MVSSLRSRNKRTSGGSNPGLTPIDDAHADISVVDLEPDGAMWRLAGQDRSGGGTSKGRRGRGRKLRPKQK